MLETSVRIGLEREAGADDLWTAAAALAHRMPFVTRNLVHFRRVSEP